MRLWSVRTIMNQTFRVVAHNSTDALSIFHKAFPVEREIRSLNDEGFVYSETDANGSAKRDDEVDPAAFSIADRDTN